MIVTINGEMSLLFEIKSQIPFHQDNKRRRLERLDFATGEWTRLQDLPDNKTSHACALYMNGFVAVGGYTGTAEDIGDIFPTNTIEYFDFETGLLFQLKNKFDIEHKSHM